jgi:hypothetical protein
MGTEGAIQELLLSPGIGEPSFEDCSIIYLDLGKDVPIPVGVAFAVTLPIAANSAPECVIRTRTCVPVGKGVVVFTKQPEALRSRVTETNSPRPSKSITSAITPK